MEHISVNQWIFISIVLAGSWALWSKLDAIWKAVAQIRLEMSENYVKKTECEKNRGDCETTIRKSENE